MPVRQVPRGQHRAPLPAAAASGAPVRALPCRPGGCRSRALSCLDKQHTKFVRGGQPGACAAFHGTAAAGKQRTAAVRVCCVSRGLMVAGRSRAAAITESSDVKRERRQSMLANTSKMSRTQAAGGKGGKLEKLIGEDADSQSKEGGNKQVKSRKSIQSPHVRMFGVCVYKCILTYQRERERERERARARARERETCMYACV